MEFLALIIKPLDDNEEAEEIAPLLPGTGIGVEWEIQRPTEETNAIIIPVVENEQVPAEHWKREQQLRGHLDRAIELLRGLERSTVAEIQRLHLDVFIRIHIPETYLFLPPDFTEACGRLGLELRVYCSWSLDVE